MKFLQQKHELYYAAFSRKSPDLHLRPGLHRAIVTTPSLSDHAVAPEWRASCYGHLPTPIRAAPITKQWQLDDRPGAQQAWQTALFVELSGGRRIGVGAGFDGATLRRLIAVLGEV